MKPPRFTVGILDPRGGFQAILRCELDYVSATEECAVQVRIGRPAVVLVLGRSLRRAIDASPATALMDQHGVVTKILPFPPPG